MIIMLTLSQVPGILHRIKVTEFSVTALFRRIFSNT